MGLLFFRTNTVNKGIMQLQPQNQGALVWLWEEHSFKFRKNSPSKSTEMAFETVKDPF